VIKGLLNSIIILLIFSAVSFGQNNDLRLAEYYYQNQEFTKAVGYYEKVYAKFKSKRVYEGYFETLVALKEYKQAEKLAKRQIKQEPFDFSHKIDLAELYENTNRNEKANEIYDDLIASLTPTSNNYISLANAFKNKDKNDLALRVLKEGRKKLKKQSPLHFQFAEIYAIQGNWNGVVDEYLDLLDFNKSYKRSVEIMFSRYLKIGTEDEIESTNYLKQKLLEYTQKYPNKIIYLEMLEWFFVQKKQFGIALRYVKSLDKKTDSRGYKVMEFAGICKTNFDYSTARKCYQFLLEFGEKHPFYEDAKAEYLNTTYLEIERASVVDQNQVNTLILEYESQYHKLRNNKSRFRMVMELTTLYAYYSDQADKAIKVLEYEKGLGFYTHHQVGKLKIQLGDIYVLFGDIWEASLLFMQVDKMFKNDPLGHEAKFKSSRVLYYSGEFALAKSQLDVLKASTSKLIANDAMRLSLLIQDNTGLDSVTTALELFAAADLLIQQHQYEAAQSKFDSLGLLFPFHGIADEVLMLKAEAKEQQHQWEGAIKYYLDIYNSHGSDILADDALFRTAEIYYTILNDKEKASEYYKKLLFEYSGSLYVVEARKKFRLIKGNSNVEFDKDKTIDQQFNEGLKQ
jgi:TolA-binding protein